MAMRPPHSPHGSGALPTVLVAGLVAMLFAVAACGSAPDTVAAQARAGDGKGYVGGNGLVEQIAPADRGTAITVRGPSLEGRPLDTGEWRGSIVVVNTWGSWCPPCNAEAPTLAVVAKAYAGRGVRFIGLNLREGPQTGLAFQRRFAIDYPSVAWDGGRVVLALRGKATSTPSTLVLDRRGRLAARVGGPVDRGTLTGLLDDALAEDGPGR
jgi:thiol-disulfide isomerase/thioredoxin